MWRWLWCAAVTAFWIGTAAELRQQSGVEVALEKAFLALTAETGENSKFQIPNKLQYPNSNERPSF